MSVGKRTLPPFTLVNGTSLASSFNSNPTSIQNMDRVCIEIICSGTPTGTVTVQGSTDYNPQTPAATANWFDFPLSLVALAGGPQNYIIDMAETAFPWLRIAYSFTAGVGNMTAVISAKES